MTTTTTLAPYWVLATTGSQRECYIIDAETINDATRTVRGFGAVPICVEPLSARAQARRNELLAAGDSDALFAFSTVPAPAYIAGPHDDSVFAAITGNAGPTIGQDETAWLAAVAYGYPGDTDPRDS